MQVPVLLATEAFRLEPEPASGLLALAWLIPLLPLVGFAVLVLTTGWWRRLGDAAGWFATALVTASFAFAVAVHFELAALPAEARAVIADAYTWIDAGGLRLSADVLVDPLSDVMVLMVTGVSAVIHLYSIGYMRGDDRYPRYFAYLNLFVFSMLVLVLASNFVVLFVGWELVGLCSYLLIGFWFEEMSNAVAAKKAMIVNRIGDASFAVGLFLIFAHFGSLSFPRVLTGAEAVLGEHPQAATAIALLLLGGAVGKSAQIPLYVWLPDAMAGPTPVSALIHAATMVTAGVYMVARVSPIYHLAPFAMHVVAWIGVATALLAALIAIQQDDIKRILAYSTVSQLGYMFVGVGVVAFSPGIFHLLTHAFFKALLFLAAGAVMHALADRTDIWQMGGLHRRMPITFWSSVAAVLAISGVPPFSGFFSKDQILTAAFHEDQLVIWALGILTAVLTGLYMGRWLIVIFLGDRRWRAAEHARPEEGGPTAESEPDTHAASSTAHGTAPASERAGEALQPHEAEPVMWIPMVVLAIGSVFAGWLNPSKGKLLDAWLHTSVIPEPPPKQTALSEPVLIALTAVAALVGLAAAAAIYWRGRPDRDPLTETLGVAALAMRRRFWVDELYEEIFVRGGGAWSRFLVWFDVTVVDGAVNGTGRATRSAAAGLRQLQAGLLRGYLAGLIAGTVVLVAAFLAQAG